MTAVLYCTQETDARFDGSCLWADGTERRRRWMLLKNGRETVEALWEKFGGRCAGCGRPLSREEAALDHIIPRLMGGSDGPENLQLLCRACNAGKADSIPGVAFQRYLAEMLRRDGRFQDVRTDVCHRREDGRQMVFDIVFTRTAGGKTVPFVVETKPVAAVTARTVNGMLQQLAYYRQDCPEARFILAVPVAVAEPYRRQVQAAGIILWDLEMLRLEIPDAAISDGDMPGAAGENPSGGQKAGTPEGYDALLERLRQCPPGREHWLVYQRLVGDILSALFCPPLGPVSEQNADGDYANRRDFILPNYAETGPWAYLERKYQAELIPVDAKNSNKPVQKNDILQVAHYLKRGGLGLFGLIFSRYGLNRAGERHLQDIWNFDGKMLVVLDDSDVEQMLLMKRSEQDPCQVILEKIQEFRLRI